MGGPLCSVNLKFTLTSQKQRKEKLFFQQHLTTASAASRTVLDFDLETKKKKNPKTLCFSKSSSSAAYTSSSLADESQRKRKLSSRKVQCGYHFVTFCFNQRHLFKYFSSSIFPTFLAFQELGKEIFKPTKYISQNIFFAKTRSLEKLSA